MKILHLPTWLSAACLVAACTTYGPQSLPKGSSMDAARAAMGPPTGEMALPDGGRRLEFARGPLGKHTYMLDYDAQGRLQNWEQV
ncbi:MAG TPA: hypothetical protein VHQ87_07560, partial [Rhizobacter sp.]|nr:hypothetical protein [Rhizobacter sp.]